MGRRVGGTIGKLAHRHRARLSHRGRPATGGTIMKAPTGATFSPEGIAPDQNRDLEPSLAFLLRLGPSRLSQGGQPGPAGIAYLPPGCRFGGWLAGLSCGRSLGHTGTNIGNASLAQLPLGCVPFGASPARPGSRRHGRTARRTNRAFLLFARGREFAGAGSYLSSQDLSQLRLQDLNLLLDISCLSQCLCSDCNRIHDARIITLCGCKAKSILHTAPSLTLR